MNAEEDVYLMVTDAALDELVSAGVRDGYYECVCDVNVHHSDIWRHAGECAELRAYAVERAR